MKQSVVVIVSLFVALMIANKVEAQWPDTLWAYTYYGGENGYCVRQTTDGGYIVGGTNAGAYGYLLKTNADGNTSWEHVFYGVSKIWSVQQTMDGGYITTGYRSSPDDVILMKVASDGSPTWMGVYGGSDNDRGYWVEQTSDSGYVIVGHTASYGAGAADVYLIKTDANGDTAWTRTYGGSLDDAGNRVKQTEDGGYIIIGWTKSYSGGGGYSDVYLIKTDANGDTTWTRTFGGVNFAYGTCGQQTTDGGYVIGGYTDSFGAGYWDAYLIKTDSNGNQTWQNTFGGVGDDNVNEMQQTSDGGYVLAGSTGSFGAGNWDFYMVKTDGDGNLTSQYAMGTDNNEYGYSIQQTVDGGYILAGFAFGYVYLIKTQAVTAVDPGETSNGAPARFILNPPHPNPFNPTTAISYQLSAISFVNLSVYDISGRKVAELVNGMREAGSQSVTFDGSGLASGIYLYRLEAGEFSDVQKMVLLK